MLLYHYDLQWKGSCVVRLLWNDTSDDSASRTYRYVIFIDNKNVLPYVIYIDCLLPILAVCIVLKRKFILQKLFANLWVLKCGRN